MENSYQIRPTSYKIVHFHEWMGANHRLEFVQEIRFRDKIKVMWI